MKTVTPVPKTETPIFVVVHNEAARDALGHLLRNAGYQAVLFQSALIFLAENPNLVSGCLVADIKTPGMDGLQLQEQLVARRLDLPVIIITGEEDIPLAVRALRAGVSAFLVKPVEEERLIESIEDALKGRIQITESDAKSTREALSKLTAREKDVLDQMVIGCADNVIARRLNISPPTVQIHRGRIKEKFRARDIGELIRNVLAVGRECQ
jgi:two-component system response regulator FixJ